MAKNWTLSEATNEILAGNKDAIVDIGRRFPLTATAIASMGNNEGALTIINALPDHITARKIESVLKDGVDEVEDDEAVEEKPANEKADKKATKAKTKKEDDEDSDDEDDPVALFKKCKAAGLKVKPKQTADYYKKELAKLEDQDDEDDDWGDDDEEVEEKKPAKKTSKKEEKKPVKKQAKNEEPEDDEDEDDDWDI